MSTLTNHRPQTQPPPEPLPQHGRLAVSDVLRLGVHGLRTRPLRAVLSALGIAIGIAAVVAVLGIPSSSKQALEAKLDTLGTNLLRAKPGQTLSGGSATIPFGAADRIKRIGPIDGVAATGSTDAIVQRNDKMPEGLAYGATVTAARPGLLDVLDATLHDGTFLNEMNSQYPAVVLGHIAAKRLGIAELDPQRAEQVWLDNQWFTVVGILDPVPLAPEIDRTVLIGWDAAKEYLGFDGHATTMYVRAAEGAVQDVQQVLGPTINPQAPNEVKVSRPSDALAAKKATDQAYSALFLGLGAVALLVGGVGVANTMVISVLERRREIGLRRALGATRRQIRGQFLVESVLLSLLGGISGVLLGFVVTGGYAISQEWPIAVPLAGVLGGFAAAALIGALAGAYPAVRASRLTPTEALA